MSGRQRAILRYETQERGLQIKRYWSSECPKCPIKAQCTPSPNRKITRLEHESVLDAMQRRLNLQPEAMTLRRSNPSPAGPTTRDRGSR